MLEKGLSLVQEKDLFSFLRERAGKIEGIVISSDELTF